MYVQKKRWIKKLFLLSYEIKGALYFIFTVLLFSYYLNWTYIVSNNEKQLVECITDKDYRIQIRKRDHFPELVAFEWPKVIQKIYLIEI